MRPRGLPTLVLAAVLSIVLVAPAHAEEIDDPWVAEVQHPETGEWITVIYDPVTWEWIDVETGEVIKQEPYPILLEGEPLDLFANEGGTRTDPFASQTGGPLFGDPLQDSASGPVFQLTFDAADFEAFNEIMAQQGWVVSDETYDAAVAYFFLKIAILVELDAFGEDFSGLAPPTFEMLEIHAAYASYFAEADRELMVLLLVAVDDRLAPILADVISETSKAQPKLNALGSLDGRDLQQIENNETGAVGAVPYMIALSELMSEGTSDTLFEQGLVGVEMADLADVIDTYTDLAFLEDLISQEEEPPSPLWYVLPIVAAVLLGLVALFWLLRRRRRQSAIRSDGDRSDFHRQLISALDEARVAEVVVPRAVRVTKADAGALLRPVDSQVRVAGTPDPVEATEFQRAIDTGQSVLTSVTDDPIVGPGTMAIAAVPVIAGGTLKGVLAVWRSADKPFGSSARDELESLCPDTGAALTSADRHGHVRHQAHMDGLTALGNRRRLDQDLSAVLKDAVSIGLPVAFAMIDVDHFKTYNDTHGHGAGDEALRRVGQIIAASVRENDVVYRYGGEEFSILLPGATADEARAVAERVRQQVEIEPISGEDQQPGGKLTISVGISSLASSSPDALKERADAALYQAKESGRNRVMAG